MDEPPFASPVERVAVPAIAPDEGRDPNPLDRGGLAATR
jgi:hypothetical protein